MLSSLLGDQADLGPLRRLISEKSEGNPLFVEEIVQALFEDGSLVRNGRLTLARPLADGSAAADDGPGSARVAY